MESIGYRLKIALKERGLTQQELAQELGVTLSTISKWCNDHVEIPAVKREKLCRSLGFHDVWPEDEFSAEEKNSSAYSIFHQQTPNRIPIFNIDAGFETYYGDEGYEPGSADQHIDRIFCKDPNAFALKLRGNSMEPNFPEGHFILVEPSAPVRPKDCVIFATENMKSFKQYVPLQEGRVKFHPLNPEHDDIIIESSKVRYIYKATMTFREI